MLKVLDTQRNYLWLEYCRPTNSRETRACRRREGHDLRAWGQGQGHLEVTSSSRRRRVYWTVYAGLRCSLAVRPVARRPCLRPGFVS